MRLNPAAISARNQLESCPPTESALLRSAAHPEAVKPLVDRHAVWQILEHGTQSIALCPAPREPAKLRFRSPGSRGSWVRRGGDQLYPRLARAKPGAVQRSNSLICRRLGCRLELDRVIARSSTLSQNESFDEVAARDWYHRQARAALAGDCGFGAHYRFDHGVHRQVRERVAGDVLVDLFDGVARCDQLAARLVYRCRSKARPD